MLANYDDVLGQLRDAGLILDSLDASGRMVRCKVDGSRERRGWYVLHELQTNGSDVLIVGTYGIWRGNDNGAIKVELRKRDSEFTAEQREALKRRLAEDRRRAEAARQEENRRAAERATRAWGKALHDGESDYLAAKGVQGFGLRYGGSGIAVVPLLDGNGAIHGLQLLRTAKQADQQRKPVKEFWPAGLAKRGHFHLIGGTPQWILLVAEGYATAASLHMATGYPVAVAFDAGNLMPVASALAKRYRSTKVLICGDDDTLQKCRACKSRLVLTEHPKTCPTCGEDHKAENAGMLGASAAALDVHGATLLPAFAEEVGRRAAFIEHGRKVSDFNDLHLAEGLHVVRAQVEARITELSWRAPVETRAASIPSTGGAGKALLKPIDSIDTLLSRFALVYGQGGTVFDHQEHMLVALGDMRDACVRRELHRAWLESPQRAIVRVQEVDFDPSGCKPGITCNLFAGWPTVPQEGTCDNLLQLLWHMCGNEANQRMLYDWVLKWLAYPLQHPGAKMKSTIVIHGPQGTGKNMFFDEYMKLFGEYGRVLDQSALEDKFNDWASRKLFLLADEVVARTEVYHLKNKLKALITGDRIRINPKNIQAYEEDNHANLVFLSNEAMPVVLEEDDRRHAVIWTPDKLPAEFYQEVLGEIRAGGTAALHHYLLQVDLGDFTNGTNPPMTAAKAELINLGQDSPQRFLDELYGQDIPGLKPRPAPSKEWYEVYKVWCGREGVKPAPSPKFINALVRKRGITHPDRARKRYLIEQTSHGPHGFLLLGNANCPDEQTESAWLGTEVVGFRGAFNEYKGRA
ncbi:DUF5906 domain-containing protein [Xanthomonas phaseoli]|uniref:DUF5906 domain-containing protein n=1 Tax=Xanthomonas phaseoli TaxID=1985254 RepID=UPI0002D8569E|nr:DUF5906 domain-containing protein [Xanthomonas phaseoli]KUF27260.1 DNA primase [Xanthomonas phaseoli pv. manihotis]MBO9722618.1 toprim domain-containing protein [Xanthomonas phaseoli pv. manihotis]